MNEFTSIKFTLSADGSMQAIGDQQSFSGPKAPNSALLTMAYIEVRNKSEHID